MTRGMLSLYVAAAEDLTPLETVQAFSRAALNLRFFPPAAILREFASDSRIAASQIARTWLRSIRETIWQRIK